MNVTFGLVAAWIAFCLGAMGVKGKGYDASTVGSDQANKVGWGATLVFLLRGQWPYTLGLVDSGGNPVLPPGPGGVPTLPGGIYPLPGGGFGTEHPPGTAPVSLPPLPPAGSVNL